MQPQTIGCIHLSLLKLFLMLHGLQRDLLELWQIGPRPTQELPNGPDKGLKMPKSGCASTAYDIQRSGFKSNRKTAWSWTYPEAAK